MVCKASSEASDGHSGNVEDITRSSTRKGKVAKRFYPKVMKVRRLAPSGIRVSSVKTCSLLLEEYVHLEYKEELLQEAFTNSASDSSMH